jgi:hypothetical protein
MLAWRCAFDPEAFSVDAVNASLKRTFQLVLKHSFAPDELTRQLRGVPPPGEPVVARYTLDDLDDPAGYVASESNHSKDRKLHKESERIYVKIAALLESHTDEKERST